MPSATGPSGDLPSLLEAMLDRSGLPTQISADVVRLAAELAARLPADAPGVPDAGTDDRIARLAAYLDGGLGESERAQVAAALVASPAALQDAIASLAHLDEVDRRDASAPPDLVDAVLATWQGERAAPANVIPLRAESRAESRGEAEPTAGGGETAPAFDSFQLLAAASGSDHHAVLCRSQSGLWTLEIFVGTSEPDRAAEQGYVLLTVHPDHRATYEGRTARVFVKVGNDERVLAEQTVRDGEIYAPVALAGLDLWTRDAVNVVFGPSQAAS